MYVELLDLAYNNSRYEIVLFEFTHLHVTHAHHTQGGRQREFYVAFEQCTLSMTTIKSPFCVGAQFLSALLHHMCVCVRMCMDWTNMLARIRQASRFIHLALLCLFRAYFSPFTSMDRHQSKAHTHAHSLKQAHSVKLSFFRP